MKYLHIFPNEKFTESFIDFINKKFDEGDHLFLIIGKNDYQIATRRNIKEISKDFSSLFLLLRSMYVCKKIFFHSLLFSNLIILILSLQPWLLSKSHWFIWGADLYSLKDSNKSFRDIPRKFVIRNVRGIITYIRGDYELARKWFGAKGNFYYSLMYPSNLFKQYNLSLGRNNNRQVFIQVGNSADPTNNHLEVFDQLAAIKEEITQIICPLSYGNMEYQKEVIKKGYEIFGMKFEPIIDFMPFDKYLEMLAKIDIAIFNHKRQQGMGNIITLLGLGKKVFIRDDITPWEFFKSNGIKVYSTNEKLDDLLESIPNNLRASNIEIIKENFSENRLRDQLNELFN